VAEVIGKAATNDIAVVKWTTNGKKKGKKKVPPKDVELHLNPVSIGLGLAAVGVGAVAVGGAAWLAGVGLEKTSEKKTVRSMRVNYILDADRNFKVTAAVAYSARNRPLFTTTDQKALEGFMLSPKEEQAGFKVSDIKLVKQGNPPQEVGQRGWMHFTGTIINPKAGYNVVQRGRWGGGGGGLINIG
jgi:hypothetical protein